MCVSINLQVSRIQKLRQTAAHFLLKDVPLNSYVGIVTFSTAVNTVSQLRKIANEAVRLHLAAKLPSEIRKRTAIGAALMAGVEVLHLHNCTWLHVH